MLTRVITGVVAFIVFIGVLLLGEVPFLVAVGVVSLVMLYEVYGATAKHTSVKIAGFISGVLLLLGRALGYTELAIALGIIVSMVFLLFLHTKVDFKEMLSTQLMTIYVILFMSYISALHKEMGVGAMCTAFLVSWGTDTAAYFAGVLFGKHKLIPNVSPKKTIEGSVGAIIAVPLLCILYVFILNKCGMPLLGVEVNLSVYIGLAIMGVVGSVISQLGDLAASAIKRDAGIKDYGSIFPGHGGFMDRFDSVIFVAPIVYYLFKFIIM